MLLTGIPFSLTGTGPDIVHELLGNLPETITENETDPSENRVSSQNLSEFFSISVELKVLKCRSTIPTRYRGHRLAAIREEEGYVFVGGKKLRQKRVTFSLAGRS